MIRVSGGEAGPLPDSPRSPGRPAHLRLRRARPRAAPDDGSSAPPHPCSHPPAPPPASSRASEPRRARARDLVAFVAGPHSPAASPGAPSPRPSWSLPPYAVRRAGWRCTSFADRQRRLCGRGCVREFPTVHCSRAGRRGPRLGEAWRRQQGGGVAYGRRGAGPETNPEPHPLPGARAARPGQFCPRPESQL